MHKNQRGNFVGQKKKKTAKRTRFQAKTAEVGCVLGAGGDESGKNRLRTDARGRHRMQHKPGKLDRIQTSLSTKNPQTMRFSQDLGTRVLAGAEGLEPSARGFGVDVGTNQQERVIGSVDRFFPQVPERAVLVWCCEEIFRVKTGKRVGKPAQELSRFAAN